MQEEKDVTNVKRRNVIIDCDPGIDDSLAIMLALSLESISVKASPLSVEILRWRWALEMPRKYYIFLKDWIFRFIREKKRL